MRPTVSTGFWGSFHLVRFGSREEFSLVGDMALFAGFERMELDDEDDFNAVVSRSNGFELKGRWRFSRFGVDDDGSADACATTLLIANCAGLTT